MSPPNESPQSSPRPAGETHAASDTLHAELLYEQGMASYQRRDWRKALDSFTWLKAIEPNWPGLDPLIDEARWLLQLEQAEQRAGATPEEEGIERRRPAAVLRWAAPLLVAGALLAVLAWWQGWLPGVGDRLEYETLYNRGQANLAVGDYQGAQQAFASLLELAPDRFTAQAQEGLERAARLEQVALAYEEANAAMLAEDWDTAEARLRSILAVDPVYADASSLLDQVLHQRAASTLFRAGVAAYDEGQYSQAIGQLERLTELDASYQRDAVRELLFVLYLRDGRELLATPDASADTIRQALARFGKALALRPRNVEAAEEQQLANRYLSVRQALERNDPAQAEAALLALLAQQPDYAGGQAAELAYGLLLQRGETARAAGDGAAAAQLFQQAQSLAVADPSQAQEALRQLQPPATATPETLAAPTPFVQVQGDSLNVRLGPGTDFPIVGQLSAGSQLALVGRDASGDWLVVCCIDGKPGWVAARLVSTEADVLALPVGLPPTRVPAASTATPTPGVTRPATATPAPAATATPAPQPTSPSEPAPVEPTPTPPPR